MKRVNLTVAIVLGALLLLNVFSFLNINNRFLSFLNSSLEQQVTLCGKNMETELENFENDLNKLLFEYKFSTIFENEQERENSLQSLEVFYAKYRDLITKIFIFDDNKNYLGLYINERDKFVLDIFPRQRQEALSSRDKVELRNGLYNYYYPYFDADKVSGNIIIQIDFHRYSEEVFSFYPVGKIITLKWVVDANASILSGIVPENYLVEDINIIADSINQFSPGMIKHHVLNEKGTPGVYFSAFYPLSVFDQNLGIVFSAKQSDFYSFFINQNLFVAIITFLLTVAIVIYLLLLIGRSSRSKKDLMLSDIVFRQIIEDFPVGILVIDASDVIRQINSAARRMMFVDEDVKLVGSDYRKQFQEAKKYLLNDEANIDESSSYLYYEKDGTETVIYRIEEQSRIGGEDLTLVTLVDVSPIERSRKQEVAANRAKSEFLASLGKEIRTPLNGILGMVTGMLNSEQGTIDDEKVRLIKRSSGLLMTIINDILDFSKMEAGELVLEEIPFQLRHEISMVADVYQSEAKEKGLTLDTKIGATIPDKLIGDPFRLRQVISNLLNNAVKFTEKGGIQLHVEELENVNGRLQLLFSIEDTGIGIPEDKINDVFNSYPGIGISEEGKSQGPGLGATIARQLVELMNGEIWAESPFDSGDNTGGPGTKISFTIEVYSNEKIEKKYNYQAITHLHQITVLFLTKEAQPDKNSITKILNGFGINIVTKIYQDSSIDSVLHHLETKKELYNLIIISDKLNLDGFTLAGSLHENGILNHYPTIMISGNDQTGNYKLCRKLAIDYYLIEPFESKEIYDIIEEVFPALTDHPGIRKTLQSLPEKLNILLVEDNIINQKIGQSIFKNIGYEIDIAPNGAEAIKRINDTSYDVIFMDLFMPEMDGFEATIRIRDKGIKIPIIAMSADIDDQRKADAKKAGMTEYLPKPAKIETVKDILLRVFLPIQNNQDEST